MKGAYRFPPALIPLLPPLLLAFSLFCICTYKFIFWYLHPLYVTADQSVYIECARLLLDGKVPCRDFFDFNPPLIMYLNVIPQVMLARPFDLPAILSFNLVVQLYTCLATGISARLAWKYRNWLSPWTTVPLIFFFAVYNQIQLADFGQREHLFIVALLPWLLCRSLRFRSVMPLKSTADRFILNVSALTAGTMMALKPQFALILLFLEIGLMSEHGFKKEAYLRCREWRYFFLPVLIYAASFLLLPQSALTILREQALTAYAFGNTWGARCFTYMVMGGAYQTNATYFAVAALLLAFFSRAGGFARPLAMMLVASYLVYLTGGQAWTYRIMPLTFCSQVLLLLIVARPLRRVGVLPLSLIACAACFYYLYGEFVFMVDERRDGSQFDMRQAGYAWGYNPRIDFDDTFFAIVQNSRPGDQVIHMGTGIRPGYPAILQAGRKPGSRYLYTYLLTMLVAAREKYPEHKTDFDRMESAMLTELGEDILKNKPRLIFVQDSPIGEILERYDFYNRYMVGYRKSEQVVDNCSVYHHTGGVKLTDINFVERERIVLEVLGGGSTAEAAADKYGVPPHLVREWVEKARQAVQDALKDRVLDREGDLSAKLEQMTRQTWDQGKEIEALKEENRRLLERLPETPKP